MKSFKKGIIRGIIGIILIVFIIISLQKAGLIGIEPDFKSYGHGDFMKSGGTSFLESLNINSNPDYINEETGEEYFFDEECWIDAEIEYEECIEGFGEIEFSVSSNQFYFYVEIIPAVSAIGIGEFPEEEILELCDEEYLDTLTTECNTRDEGEVYVWDGTPINDLGSFVQYAFPDTRTRWIIGCEGWIYNGEWIEEVNEVGCKNARWLSCDSANRLSAKEVCETIGRTWVCDETQSICKD